MKNFQLQLTLHGLYVWRNSHIEQIAPLGDPMMIKYRGHGSLLV